MEIFQSYGIAESVLEILEKNEFDEIHLKIGERETLISKVSDWKKKGFEYHKPPFERQWMLREKDMTRKFLPLSALNL